MYPILFKAGMIEIHAYGFFLALAFLVAILVSMRYARKEGLDPLVILDLSIYVIIAGIIGARALYLFEDLDFFLKNPAEIIMVHHGGLAFLGGFLLSMVVIAVFAKRKGISFLKLLDAISPGSALGYAFGRIGCFLNGCCFGLPTKLPWGIVFPTGSLAGNCYPGETLQPTQLYSALSMVIVSLILAWLYRAKKFDGQIILWGIVLYALYRFLMEFIRYNPIRWLFLSQYQWLVLILFIFGIGGLIYKSRSSK